MKRKGFTLVELLTVIAILAIILLIASPIILNVLEKAKQNTFKNQALLYVEGLKQQAVLSGIGEGNIVLPSNNESIDIDVSTITLEIDKNYTGKIRITNNNGKYEYTLIDVTGDGYVANGPINKIVVTKAGNKPDTPTPTYTAYTIGQQVTLKDNSTWYVIENSGSDSDTVTLFASKNIKNDASEWTTVVDKYKIAFDENNSNVYENSSIKSFIDGSVKSYINNSLVTNGGIAINSIRLITTGEVCNMIDPVTCGTGDDGKLLDKTSVPEWIYSTNYWTMTSYVHPDNQSAFLYIVDTINPLYGIMNASDTNNGIGVRPVIVTNKSNIK